MKILIVEDDKERIKWFQSHLIGHLLTVTDKVDIAKVLFSEHEYDLAFLDHDLADEDYRDQDREEENGSALARFLFENPQVAEKTSFVIHSLNQNGVARMLSYLANRNVQDINFIALRAMFGDKQIIFNG